MLSERQRRQYLEAMGISVWVARRPIPHALEAPLPPVEEAPRQAPPDHGQRLHALLDDIESAPAAPAAEPPVAQNAAGAAAPSAPARRPGASRRSARALLEPSAEPSEVVEPGPHEAPADTPAPREAANGEPLRFTIQVAALEGRWLLLLAREGGVELHERKLLEAVLAAADIHSSKALSFEPFGWPMMEGLPTVDALDEARQGFRAFLAGRHARGWQPERILLFGRLPVLEEVLDVDRNSSRLLSLPFWQGPALEALSTFEGRRELWRLMAPWRQWWHWSEDAGECNEGSPGQGATGRPDSTDADSPDGGPDEG